MVQITTLSTADQGWALDDSAGHRPWPIAADATAWAIIMPEANYRIARTTRAVTRRTHDQDVAALASSVAGRLTGNQIRPFIAAWQSDLATIAAVFRLDVDHNPANAPVDARTGLRLVTRLETLTPTTALRPGSEYSIPLVANADANYNAAAVTSAAAADNTIGILEDDYDGVWARPVMLYPTGRGVDAAGGNLVVQRSAVSAHTSQFLSLTPTRITGDQTSFGATLPVEIPARSIGQCDVIGDPADTSGNTAWAAQIVDRSAVLVRGVTIRTATTDAEEVARIRLPAGRDTYATIDNLYLAVNARYVWLVAVNRLVVDRRPTLVYQRYDRSGGTWLTNWVELLPPGVIQWASGDFMPRQIGLARVPSNDEIAVAVTHAVRADVNNRTYLLTDRAVGPRQPIITRPAADGAILDVARPLDLGWSYNDPGGRPQGAYRLRRRVAGVDTYWAPASGDLIVAENYLQWRQYDLSAEPGSLLANVRLARAPDRIGSGDDTRDDTDNGTPTADNVLVVRILKCRVNGRQTVRTVRWRSAVTGVNRVIRHGLFPTLPNDAGPDLSAPADGAAEESLETTSRWTSTQQTLTTVLIGGTVFYAVGTGWVDTAADASVDFEISFDGGANWYGDIGNADDTRVEFLEWEWTDQYIIRPGWSATLTPATRVESSTPAALIPENWATAGGAAWQIAVTVWNADDDQSAESPARTIRPGGAAPPTVTAPVTGAVSQILTITVEWTVASQTRYAVWLEDGGGVPITPTAPVELSAARAAAVVAPGTGTYTVVVATWSTTGYRSETRVANVTVGHATALTAPTCTVDVPANARYIRVRVGSVHSTVDYWRVWRRVRGEPDTAILLFAGRRVATNAEHRDHTAESGVEYEYQAEVWDTTGPRTNVSAWTR